MSSGVSELFRQQSQQQQPQPLSNVRLLVPSLVLTVMLSLSGLIWYLAAQAHLEKEALLFENNALVIEQSLQRRLNEYTQLLTGMQAFFMASEQVTQQEFHDYVESMNLEINYPGLRAVQFATWVRHQERQAFEQKMRRDPVFLAQGYSPFAIHPKGQREAYLPVIFNEPMKGNEVAIGQDQYASLEHRQVMESARDTGLIRLSAPMTLVQDSEKEVGFVMRAPVYQHAAEVHNLAQRRRAYLGQLSVMFRAKDTLQAAIPMHLLGEVHIRVDDVQQAVAGNPELATLLDTGASIAAKTPWWYQWFDWQFAQVHTIDIAGRSWQIRIAHTPKNPFLQPIPIMTFLGLMVFSVLLWRLVGLLSWQRLRAVHIADQLSYASRRREILYKSVLENLHEVIFQTDKNFYFTYLNPAWNTMMGYSSDHTIGHLLSDYVHHDDVMRVLSVLQIMQQQPHERMVEELRFVTQQQDIRWMALSIEQLRDEHHAIIGLNGTLRDITEQIQAEQAVLESATRVQSVVQTAVDGIIVTDALGRIETFNPAAEKMFGYETNAVLGRHLSFLLPALPGLNRGQHANVLAMLAFNAEVHQRSSREMSAQHQDGRLFTIELVVSSMLFGDQVKYTAMIRDITERKESERRLFNVLSMQKAIVQNAPIAILVTDEQGMIYTINPAFTAMTGYSELDIKASLQWLTLHHSADIAERISVLKEELLLLDNAILTPLDAIFYRARQHKVDRFEIRIVHKDGHECDVWESVTPLDDFDHHAKGYLIILSDISERKAAEARIAHLAQHDALTGLPNRALMEDRLKIALVAAKRNQTKLAVMFMDLDRFKNINDTLGHGVGDQVLKIVAQRIADALRQSDTVARMGGDEFVILLPDINSPDDVNRVASNILWRMAETCKVYSHELYLTSSIGIAVYPQDGEDIDTLMKHADAALYLAKETGRNNFKFFTQELNQAAAERLSIETHLRKAVEHNELELFYQPIFNMQQNKVIGAEALLRWTSGERGAVSPVEFIPVAEDTGLILPIGSWVLNQAFESMNIWRQTHDVPFRLSINLSARQFRHPQQLLDSIQHLIAYYNVPASCIELELTESILMQRTDEILKTMQYLNALGIKLVIDDFGTGYSSLSYLKQFPIDKIKIDRSFVRDIMTDANDAAIASAIIAMAKSLNMRVVAEGIENQAQFDFLAQQGCDEGQGYLFSRPISYEHFSHFYKKELLKDIK